MTHLRRLLGALALASFALAGHAAPDCDRPDAPPVPDAAEATEETLIEAQEAVQGFVAEGEEYLDCLRQAEAAGMRAGEMDEEEQQALLEAYNSMVDEMEAAAGAFNEAAQAWRESQE